MLDDYPKPKTPKHNRHYKFYNKLFVITIKLREFLWQKLSTKIEQLQHKRDSYYDSNN